MGLLDFILGRKPQPQPNAGPGILAVPKGTTQQSYQDYAEMQMTKGQQPLSMADWLKQQQAQAAQAPVAPKP